MIDYSEMWEQFRAARWDALLLIGRSFVDAASLNPWMWAVLGLVLFTAGRKKLVRLARFIGSAYWHRQP